MKDKDYYICNKAKEILLDREYIPYPYHKLESGVSIFEINKKNWNNFLEHIEKCEVCSLREIKRDIPLLNMFLSYNKLGR